MFSVTSVVNSPSFIFFLSCIFQFTIPYTPIPLSSAHLTNFLHLPNLKEPQHSSIYSSYCESLFFSGLETLRGLIFVFVFYCISPRKDLIREVVNIAYNLYGPFIRQMMIDIESFFG